MGRTPHPTITYYFDRGQKLAHNRYLHTCKRCKADFPKGRVDGLFNHLVRKCPRLTEKERQLVHQAMETSRSKYDDSPVPEPVCMLQRESSALDTLAEVSQHHLDHSTYKAPAVELSGQQDGEEADLEMLSHLQAATKDIDMESTATTETATTPKHDSTSSTPLPLVAYGAPESIPSGEDSNEPVNTTKKESHQEFDAPTETASEREAVPVSQAAAVLLYESASRRPSSNEAVTSTHDSPFSGQQSLPTEQTVAWSSTNASGTASFGRVTATLDLDAGFGLLQRSPKDRKRTRFSDTRRKEVSKVRKQGACMRCRMLKKPCSEETPCSTCSSVETARLWKGKCLRSRLSDELVILSTGLFHAKASLALTSATYGLQDQQMNGRIEVRLFSCSELCMSFAPRMYISPLVDYRATPGTPKPGGSTSGALWLLDDGEGTVEKVENYMNMVADACIKQESNGFIKATLQRAQQMAKSEGSDRGAKEPDSTKRSCYKLQQNHLLQDVVELWSATTALTLHRQQTVMATYDPSRPPSTKPDMAHRSIAGDFILSSPNQHLINTQILAAIESRCRILSKVVMNELEKRLLQRQDVSPFGTFLASVILLNITERMTAVYKAFDLRSFVVVQEDKPDSQIASKPIDWPLDKSPSQLWSQGEYFAELLITLLRMRQLPPKTATTSNGELIVHQEYASPVKLNGKPVKSQTGEQSTIQASWLDPLHILTSDMERVRDRPLPQGEDAAKWDLKFIARVLLPLPP